MSLLGLSESSNSNLDVRANFRKGWFRHVGVVIGGASGASVVLGGYELMRSQPAQAFDLLRSWGPMFLIVIVALFVAGKFLDGVNSTVRESFSMVASSVKSQAEAASRTADALTRLAEQGGRQAQEVQRLAIYAAQEFPTVYERFDRQDAMLEKTNCALGEVAKALVSLQVRGGNDH